jgi:hypothetical protein
MVRSDVRADICKWACDDPMRRRSLSLQTKSPVTLYESVSDEALPRLVSVLKELRRQVPASGEAGLRNCHDGVTERRIELGSALNKLSGISQDAKQHAFRLGIAESDGNLILSVPSEEAVTVDRLCWEEILD